MVELLYLENETIGERVQMDMENADYLLYEGGIEWGVAGSSHNTFKFPGQIGETRTSTSIETRDVSISGWIVGKTLGEIEKKKARLSVIVNPLQELHIDVGDYRLDGLPVNNVDYSSTYQENNDKMCKFLIQIFCPFPLFKIRNGITQDSATLTGMFAFPLILKPLGEHETGYGTVEKFPGVVFGKIEETRFLDILNDGTVEIGCVFTIRVNRKQNASANNPTIINVSTREKIRINKKMARGDMVIIDTNKGTRSVKGVSGGQVSNYLDYMDINSVWMQLPVGMNTFTVRTYDDAGKEDDTNQYVELSVYYFPCKFNLDGE